MDSEKQSHDESEFSDGVLESQGLLHSTSYNDVPKRKNPSFLAVLCCILAATVAILTFVIVRMSSAQDVGDMHQTSKYFSSIDRSYKTQLFKHFNYTHSAYTGEPSSSVDAAWADLGADYWPFFIPVSQGSALGLEQNRHALISKELLSHGHDGKPITEDQYLAEVESVHWLHCLNTIRKSLYYTREYYAALEETPKDPEEDEKLNRSHIDHCIDALRERLMCTADIEPLPWVWVGQDGFRMPDFARPHQCHDFEAVRKWAEAHQVPAYVDKIDFKPPQNAIVYEKDFFT